MAKRQRQINYMFHPIGKDEILLSIASDIEVLTATNVLINRHFDDYFVLSLRPFDPIISKKIRLDHF